MEQAASDIVPGAIRKAPSRQEILCRLLGDPKEVLRLLGQARGFTRDPLEANSTAWPWYVLYLSGIPTPYAPDLVGFLANAVGSRWRFIPRDMPPLPADMYVRHDDRNLPVAVGFVIKVHSSLATKAPALTDWFKGLEINSREWPRAGTIHTKDIAYYLRLGST